MTEKLRVAFCQPQTILGGRLQVIIGITQVLNEMGIVPDLLTFKAYFKLQDIEQRYGDQIKLNIREISGPHLPQDFSVLLFHNLLRRYAHEYDLLINTSNSLIFLPDSAHVLTYMFYPRKSRIQFPAPDIHDPDEPLRLLSRVGIEKALLRLIYRLSKPNPKHHIICMTRFTCEALHREYPSLPDNLPLIYPAVDIADFKPSIEVKRQKSVIAVGRFHPSKRQLEQVKLAQQLPEMDFHIVGFADEHNAYYHQCAAYTQSNNLTNVHLHRSIPFAEMIALLHQSKYFLHTMINEPFGLTAVQAIAAGCVPLVHDSGGQRETVPLPQLRYQTLDEVPALLEKLEALPESEIDAMVRELQAHAHAHYDEAVFHQQMRDILTPILNDILAESKTGA